MRKILDRVGLESEMIAQSEAVAWVMRPNKRLKESVSLWARYLNIGKTDQVDGTMRQVLLISLDIRAFHWRCHKSDSFIVFIYDMEISQAWIIRRKNSRLLRL